MKRWVIKHEARTADPSEASWTEYLQPLGAWSRSLRDAALFKTHAEAMRRWLDSPFEGTIEEVRLIAPQPRADGNGMSGWFVLDANGQFWDCPAAAKEVE